MFIGADSTLFYFFRDVSLVLNYDMAKSIEGKSCVSVNFTFYSGIIRYV